MAIYSLKYKNLLTPPLKNHFSQQFLGNIWKIWLDAQAPLLLIEIRNGTTYHTHFSLLSLENFCFIWQDYQLEETWWVGVSALHNRHIFFYTYQDEQQPFPQDLWVVQADSQQLLWKSEQYLFQGFYQDQLITYQNQGESLDYYATSLSTGKILKKIQPKKENWLQDCNIHLETKYPMHYKTGQQYFETVQKFLFKRFQIQAIHCIDYLEYGGFILMAYFCELENAATAHHLLVLNQKGSIVWQDCLQKEAKGLNLDSFFVFEHKLFYIKNKTELLIYQL